MIIWSRETDSAVLSRVSLLISILRLNLVPTYEISPVLRGGVHLFTQTAIRHQSGNTFAYRWRPLPPRVRRHRPVNIKVVPNGCCLGRVHRPVNMGPSFPQSLLVRSGHVESTDDQQPASCIRFVVQARNDRRPCAVRCHGCK